MQQLDSVYIILFNYILLLNFILFVIIVPLIYCFLILHGCWCFFLFVFADVV